MKINVNKICHMFQKHDQKKKKKNSLTTHTINI